MYLQHNTVLAYSYILSDGGGVLRERNLLVKCRRLLNIPQTAYPSQASANRLIKQPAGVVWFFCCILRWSTSRQCSWILSTEYVCVSLSLSSEIKLWPASVWYLFLSSVPYDLLNRQTICFGFDVMRESEIEKKNQTKKQQFQPT